MQSYNNQVFSRKSREQVVSLFLSTEQYAVPVQESTADVLSLHDSAVEKANVRRIEFAEAPSIHSICANAE